EYLPLILEKALASYRETSIRSSQPLRVLYAEPHTSDADLAKRHLAGVAPHIVMDVVTNASGVFKLLSDQHIKHPFDVILLDYRLPGMNALEILKELRQVSRTDLPIVLITGQGDEEVAVQALKLGATDYLVKNQGYLYKLPFILENAVHSVQLTREHKTIAKLKRQNELILNSAGEGIVGMDLAGNQTFANPAAARILGYEISEMIGANGHSLWHHTKIDGSRYHEEACTIYTACMEGTVLDDQEDLFWRKNGTSFPVEFSLMPILEDDRLLGSVLTFRDITERKRAHLALQESEELFRKVFQDHTAVKLIIDPDTGNIIDANKAALHFYKWSHEQLTQMKIQEINTLPPEEVKKELEKARYDKRVHFEFRHRRADGSIRDVDVFTSKINVNKKDLLHSIIHDVTIRKQAEEKLQETLLSLKKAVSTTIQVIGSTVETRDPYTSAHQLRCADLACAIATEMKLSNDTIEGTRMAGIIHDLGKLSIPAEILSKPTELSPIEFSLIKEHPRKGYEILKDVESPWPLAEIVYQHHERIDGSGYPRNLKGDDILIEARILAVCDVVESMVSHRPYRAALGVDMAMKEIEDRRGILYDVDVVDVCLRLFREKGYRF
ncbi:MAG TPA: PAS domain S-box protein, partial [Syntrophales bacterium]|nr:PAS domain S-box protein [Syntrophales bacterium]